MHETPQDLAALQRVLDDSYARAGAHLRSIHTDKVRLTAEELVERFTGMKVVVVATVSADGRPLTSPVDGFLFRGAIHFSTDPDAVRARHLAERPQVSATWVNGEAEVLTVHGRVRPLDLAGTDAAYAAFIAERYGTDVSEWVGVTAWAIEAERMFAADMSRHHADG